VEKGETNTLNMLASLEQRHCDLDDMGHCITCSDEAQTVRVVGIDWQVGLALVSRQEMLAEVDVTLIDEVEPGDWLLVHGGVAIERLERSGIGRGNDAWG
jgi:hydrogenase maturation factor